MSLVRGVLFLLLILSLVCMGCSKGIDASAQISKQLELAVKYLSEYKFEEAVLAYQEAIKIDPKNVTAYKGIGVAYQMMGKPDLAEKILQDGLKKVDDSSPLDLTLAGVLLDIGQKDKAIAIYKDIINENKLYFPAYQALTRIYIADGSHDEALKLLTNALASNSDQYILNNFLAEVYIKSGNREKTLENISKSLFLEPNQSEVYKLLEYIYPGNWPDLIVLGEQYIQQNQVVAGQILKFIGLSGQGNYDKVIKQYNQLPKEIIENARIKIIVAGAYVNHGQKEVGLALLKDINVSGIKDAGLIAELAGFYLEFGNKDTARKLALKGINLDDTVIENYTILYSSYFDEDKSQAAIWSTKYLLSSIMGIKDSQKEQKQQIEKNQDNIQHNGQKPSVTVWKYINACKHGQSEAIWQLLSTKLKQKLGSAKSLDISTLGEANAWVNYMITREDVDGEEAIVEITGGSFCEGAVYTNVVSTFKLVFDDGKWCISEDGWLERMEPLPLIDLTGSNTVQQENNSILLSQSPENRVAKAKEILFDYNPSLRIQEQKGRQTSDTSADGITTFSTLVIQEHPTDKRLNEVLFQVFYSMEYYKNGNWLTGHAATIGWYRINPDTGEIYDDLSDKRLR